MGLLIARVGDSVKHVAVSGAIIPAGNAIKTNCESLLVAKNGGSATCDGDPANGPFHAPGTFTIIATSLTVNVEGAAIARNGDTLTCGATIIAGSTKSFAG